jgi:hypothetical protein
MISVDAGSNSDDLLAFLRIFVGLCFDLATRPNYPGTRQNASCRPPLWRAGFRFSGDKAFMRNTELASVRAAILGALGLGAGGVTVGCGGLVVFEEDGAGGSGNTTQTATTGTKGTSGQTTNASTGTGSTTSGVTTGGGCTTPISATAIPPPAEGPCGGFPSAQYICFPKLPDGPACTAIYSEACVLDAYSCGFAEVGTASCPDFGADQCCFIVVGDCPIGRPFMVGGTARLASVAANGAWTADDGAVMPTVALLDQPTRDALAAFWTREALTEHASVASFSRFVLQLLALGAPADLVRDATRATADEVEHARIAFSFASEYGGRHVGPTELDVSGALDGIRDRAAAAVSMASEGCVAETVSALLLRAAAEEATDPAVKAALTRIADDEMDHALLAWRALGWMLASGDEAMRASVAEVFERSTAHVGLGPVVEAGDPARMRAHGYLPLAERRSRAAEVLATVVAPCARTLLADERTSKRSVARAIRA